MSENIEYKVDRDGWPRGPWDNEKDRYEWRDEDTGLPCLIVRNSWGALCGYVGVAPEHPFHGREDDGSSDVGSMNVHGGVTYTNKCAGHICHVPLAGETEDVWWVGFDCNHCMDLAPSMGHDRNGTPRGGTYRNVAYVREECKSLASQLYAVK